MARHTLAPAEEIRHLQHGPVRYVLPLLLRNLPLKEATPRAPAPAAITASEIMKAAEQYVGVPYVYGGFSPNGFDCSGYISWIWKIPRRTTETIDDTVRPITKDELLPGDLLNMPMARDPSRFGHMRIFDKWATADRGLVWIYEETEPRVMHRIVPYDPRYAPMRRINVVSDVPMPPPPLPADWNKPPKRAPAPAAIPATVPTVLPKPPATILGRVLDEKTGQPVPRARVFYWTQEGRYSVSSVLTGADGAYAMAKLEAGTYEMAAYANGYDVEFPGGLDLRTGGTARFDLRLAPAIGAVAGQRLGAASAATVTQDANASRDLADPPAMLPLDHEIPAGRFFTQTAGRDGIIGYAVTNEGDVKLWDEFQRLGGVQALGYPVSGRFQWKGFTVQAMQKGVLQWRPEVGRAWLTNVFDEMSAAGKDDWLYTTRATPRPLDPSFDGGKPWAQVLAGRMSLLDARMPLARRFAAAGDPLMFFGLPTSKVEDMGNHFAVRLQRGVVQLWKVDVPWAKAGETTVANGGDVAKEAGLFPAEVVTARRSPLLRG